jgi:hypothetical protein
LLCHCRHPLEAGDNEALLGLVRIHLLREHPAAAPTDEQIREIVATRAYDFEYAEVDFGGVGDEFDPDPY